jgi:hypothetical protein
VLWNNPFYQVPLILSEFGNIKILTSTTSSLNNRWTIPIPYITTEAVVVHDDDMFALPSLFECMYASWLKNPQRLVSFTVRRIENSSNHDNMYYLMNSLEARNASYNIAIRMILISTKNIQLYNATMTNNLLDYITNQEGMCDDIAINMIATSHTGLAPLRILPDTKSLYFFDECRRNGFGLTSDPSRGAFRTECSKFLAKEISTLKSVRSPTRLIMDTNEIEICPSKVNRVASYNAVSTNINDFFARKPWLETFLLCDEAKERLPSKHNTEKKKTKKMHVKFYELLNQLRDKRFRVGILSNEFWAINIDDRKGG